MNQTTKMRSCICYVQFFNVHILLYVNEYALTENLEQYSNCLGDPKTAGRCTVKMENLPLVNLKEVFKYLNTFDQINALNSLDHQYNHEFKAYLFNPK